MVAPILHGQGAQRRWNVLDVALDEVLARRVEDGGCWLRRAQGHRHDKELVEKHNVDGNVQVHKQRHQQEANARDMLDFTEEVQLCELTLVRHGKQIRSIGCARTAFIQYSNIVWKTVEPY